MEALKTYNTESTLAEQMTDRMKELKMNITEAALRVHYSRSTLSQYLSGKYTSDPTEIEKNIREFLEQTGGESGSGDGKGEAATPLRKKVQYFESRDYVQTIGLCSSCQNGVALGIIVARSGYGKTHALKKYATMPRVVYIEGNETMNCKDIVRRIESRIGMQRSYGSIDERTEKIIDFFNINEGYLIIMDEADKLINKYTQKKIELLRNITDGARVGLVLAGEPVLESLLRTYDNRFANRMDFYYKLGGLSKSEVADYLEGYDIDDAAMGEMVSRATNTQSGCFRLLDRTLNNVLRILKQKGETRITLKVVSEASSMMML